MNNTKGKVCRRGPGEMGLPFRIQSLVCFDTSVEAFDNYFRFRLDSVSFYFFLDPGEDLRLYIGNQKDERGRRGPGVLLTWLIRRYASSLNFP
jgi:hypothetical protein